MRIFTKLILLLFFIINTSYADIENNHDPNKTNDEIKHWVLVKPKPTIRPAEVLLIQLNALKNNSNPYVDFGIEQTWEFAHPNNKIITGPLEKFKKMIYSESYEILIDHENHKVEKIEETDSKQSFKVFVLSKDKKKYYYIWQVEKVLADGGLINCWMTTNVSNPRYLGDVI